MSARSILDESDLGMVLAFDPFDGDRPPLDLRRLRNRIVTAAKAHRCHGCSDGVEAGERHRVLVEVSREDGAHVVPMVPGLLAGARAPDAGIPAADIRVLTLSYFLARK